jgi:hypothetical protein
MIAASKVVHTNGLEGDFCTADELNVSSHCGDLDTSPLHSLLDEKMPAQGELRESRHISF